MLLTRSPGYVLQIEAEQLDSERFERLLQQGIAALGRDDPRGARELLEQALTLWRGPVLAEFEGVWLARSNIACLQALRLAAVEARIDADLALGRQGLVIGELEALIARYPLRERLRSQLMLALYRTGRQAEALEAYHAAREASYVSSVSTRARPCNTSSARS